jgi:hypothetical protein
MQLQAVQNSAILEVEAMNMSMECKNKGCENRCAVSYRFVKKRGGWEIGTIHSRCEHCLNAFRAKKEANRIKRARDFRDRMDALGGSQ